MQPTIQVLEELAREAGKILRAGYEQEHEIRYKGVIDLVTEVDHQSEAYLIDEIRKRYPGHKILAEESGVTSGSQDSVWIIDPLDGTVNYAHQIPIFTVSIGYSAMGRMSLGVVYDPMRDELYGAERNAGSFMNGKRIHSSEAIDLKKSLLVTGFPYDAWDTDYDNFGNYVRFAKQSQGVRRLGSAALDCCYVAAGRFDGFWELQLNPWDVAAGGLIAEESGAKVTNVRGKADYLSAPQSIIACAPGIYEQMLKVLNTPVDEKAQGG